MMQHALKIYLAKHQKQELHGNMPHLYPSIFNSISIKTAEKGDTPEKKLSSTRTYIAITLK